jgi:hypothetical protein
MSYPTLPDPGTGSSADPTTVLRDLLVRYFRPGLVDSLIRTWVPIVLGYVLSYLAVNFEWLNWAGLPDTPSPALSMTFGAAVTAGYYALARVVERKWPVAGRWMLALNLTKARPTYAEPAAAAKVEAAAAEVPPPTSRY